MAKRNAPKLKSPYPYFGGKARAAPLVWERLGNVQNYVEPFFGSGAVALQRPHHPKTETFNDLYSFVPNFWRAVTADPEKVAYYADNPVVEVDMHARHLFLTNGEAAENFRLKVSSDPEYHDAKFAGWWVWGLCCWIGSGWCADGRSAQRDTLGNKRGVLNDGTPDQSEKRPVIDNGSRGAVNMGRPQLADAYDIGLGVNAMRSLPTCAERQRWLVEWFGRLRDRFRLARFCCGDWARVCTSRSVLTRLGVTGVFLDPPYHASTGRRMGLYPKDSKDVSTLVGRWALKWGDDPRMRICVAGLDGEHTPLESAGWTCESWDAPGGYNNRTANGKANRLAERLWFSPNCLRPAPARDLFSFIHGWSEAES